MHKGGVLKTDSRAYRLVRDAKFLGFLNSCEINDLRLGFVLSHSDDTLLALAFLREQIHIGASA